MVLLQEVNAFLLVKVAVVVSIDDVTTRLLLDPGRGSLLLLLPLDRISRVCTRAKNLMKEFGKN